MLPIMLCMRMREGLFVHSSQSSVICTYIYLCLKLTLREMLVSLSLKLQPAGLVHHHHTIGRQSHFATVFLPRCADEATQWRQYSTACRAQRDQPASERQHDTIVQLATALQRLRPQILNSAHSYTTSSFLNSAHQPYVSRNYAATSLTHS